MKYMILMQGTAGDFGSFGRMAPADIARHIQFMNDLNAEWRASGELVDAQGLALPDQAKIVRATPGGAPAVTDGPFAEAKEFLAGYWIVECASPGRAIELAARVSGAPGPGGEPLNFPVELRPIGSPPER